jgi:chain length determinant protein tyrosine kinase EpsG
MNAVNKGAFKLDARTPLSNPNSTLLNPIPSRPLGEILMQDGHLTGADVDLVLKLQYERNLMFGEAAILLGLIRRVDVERALSDQFEYPYLVEGESCISEEVVAAYHPTGTGAEEMRMLRNQLLLAGFGINEDRKKVAIVSAGRGEGRSYIAANLAVMFSQQGQRTLLLDADMRNPRQHLLFNLMNRAGLSAALSGRASEETVQQVSPFSQLHVLPAGSAPPNPLELLGRSAFHPLLDEKSRDFDIVLIDTPAGAHYGDFQNITNLADGVLVVVRKDESRIAETRRLIELMARGRAFVIGVAVNQY